MVADDLEGHNRRVASVFIAEQQIEKHQTGGACGEQRNQYLFALDRVTEDLSRANKVPLTRATTASASISSNEAVAVSFASWDADNAV
jgi:hypothetical protein